ncbi:MAG: 1-aminocyclopropane-1-carboxylate deaminase [Rhodobacteraceae bacterium]|nr:MAG: 1-aminocyclopropane-1-carboxylate deaminase [Paracoccaceae bacterium]
MKTSLRSDVDPFLVMDIMQEAALLERQGRSVIHMEVGQPSSGAPKEALQQLYDRSLVDTLGYSVALGIPQLREKIAAIYKKRYKLRIDPQRVIITSGSSAAFILVFTAFFDVGDKILIGEPGYPSYKNILKSLNLKPELHSTTLKDRFQLNLESVLHSESSGILVASPANPTGLALRRNEFKSLIECANKKKMTFISDEIYHGLNFNGSDVCALEFDDNAIVINSFSKYFSLTGWRLGWVIVPSSFTRTLEKLAQNLFICPSHASQLLGLFVLNSSVNFDHKVEQYKSNRDLLMRTLPKIGFKDILEPDGAFYLYADVSAFKKDSLVLVKQILRQTGVAITPGYDFDTKRGHKTVRFSFACSHADVEDALNRLTDWYQTYQVSSV